MQPSRTFTILLIFSCGLCLGGTAEQLLVPMDESQANHLRAYGLAYWALQSPRHIQVEWLLNYRGGSFLIRNGELAQERAVRMGITSTLASPAEVDQIHSTIAQENMEVVLLEKAPKVAVYTPPDKEPWDDAVTLALTYAEIPYETLWDDEVLAGRLPEYDWLHLHHEDFTGQYGKFYRNFRTRPWYQTQVRLYNEAAQRSGFPSVAAYKAAVSARICEYIAEGGFLFAMCAATDTLDIARAADGLDIIPPEIDGTPIQPGVQDKLVFSKTLAFRDFQLVTDPMAYEFSDIDTSPSPLTKGAYYKASQFELFEFSAKFDPVPTMLNQNHVHRINDFLGQTTSFRRSKLKPQIIVLGEFPGQNVAKYIHGVFGQGTFTFLGGHDPEDREHHVGEQPTDLAQFPNSPGYRLILNNILFPAAKRKEQKT